MSNRYSLRSAIRYALLLGASAAATTPLQAQETSQAEPEVTEVIVTGSRIVQPNQVSTSPVQVVTNEDISVGGKLDVTDVLNDLPQINSNSLGQDLGNRTSGLSSAGGVATANLRGLGPNRTLVLVNGRRLGAGSPNTCDPIARARPGSNSERTDRAHRCRDRWRVCGLRLRCYRGCCQFHYAQEFRRPRARLSNQRELARQRQWLSHKLVWGSGRADAERASKDGRTDQCESSWPARISPMGAATSLPTLAISRPMASKAAVAISARASSMPLTISTGTECAGSGNSNYFEPVSNPDPNGLAYTSSAISSWNGERPIRTPPALFNSQPYIYIGRDNERFNGGFQANFELERYCATVRGVQLHERQSVSRDRAVGSVHRQ